MSITEKTKQFTTANRLAWEEAAPIHRKHNQTQLIESGVSGDKIKIIPSEIEAIDAALNMAKEGDLLLVFGDAITRCWKQIIHFNKEAQKSSKSKTPQANLNSNVILEQEEKSYLKSADLITDEKGVRLARVEEND
jgi:cyanophycin synthetase